MFITTANTTETIPPALLDRMELIEFPSYTQEEKLIIAERFLIPRQLEQNGLAADEIDLPEGSLIRIIREYTWEAGVRNLEREIGKICRKMARKKAEGRKLPAEISTSMLSRLLGPSQVHPQKAEKKHQVGAATALVWTENGGDTMPIEVLLVSGKGNYQITGQIGDVMQESAQAAISYVKSRMDDFGLDQEIFENTDLHIHIPEGSIPKDGPSAGVTMAVALTSALTGRPVRKDIGMTGEITLRGRVLPVGGIREKYLAAYRLPLHSVVLPKANRKDLVDIPKNAKDAVGLHFVDHMDQVIELAILPRKSSSQRNLSAKQQPESSSGARPTF
jgi:ATP-dependent Lon protease